MSILYWKLKAIMSRTKDSCPCECVCHGNSLLILLHHCRQVTANNESWENKPERILGQIWLGILDKVSLLCIHSADFIKLTFEVHLSNLTAPIYKAISSYYLTSSVLHLTSISELLSGIFLAMTDSDRVGILTAVKWHWMPAFNHNTVLNCRQTAERRCVCARCRVSQAHGCQPLHWSLLEPGQCHFTALSLVR